MNKEKLIEWVKVLRENADSWEYVSCNQMAKIIEAILEDESL